MLIAGLSAAFTLSQNHFLVAAQFRPSDVAYISVLHLRRRN